jgi:hypothetical protein
MHGGLTAPDSLDAAFGVTRWWRSDLTTLVLGLGGIAAYINLDRRHATPAAAHA